jgi:outer membrane protein assembly factor BamB
MATPAIADGYLIYGTTRSVVRALREEGGEALWQFGTKDGVFSSLAIWRGWAFVADTGRRLYALRLADGALVWQRELDGIAYSSPVVVEGSVIVATGAPVHRLQRFDAETGRLLWRTGADVIDQEVNGSVTVAEGRVIVGEMNGRYHSFALATGAHQWTTQVEGDVHMASPLVINGRVYFVPGGASRRAHAVELESGKPVSGWPTDLPEPEPPTPGTLLRRNRVLSSLAGAGGRIVVDRRIEDLLDRNGDGSTDFIVAEESVLAIDPSDRKVVWSRPNGRLETSDPNRLPFYGFCPTPALYDGVGGERLVVVSSSLSPRIRVLELGGGQERWSGELSGTTRSSPLMANGRLVVGTDAGVIHSFVSRTNRAPLAAAPLAPVAGREVDASAVTLRWNPAVDPEGAPPRHEVRLDDDGEVLHDWDLTLAVPPGQTSLELAAPLAPGRVYTFAVRARDAHGAWSPWSALGQFRAVMAPEVQLDGVPVAGLSAALQQARAGGVISLGAGTFPLSATLRLPAGVSLVGAAPHLTVLSGKGLAVAVEARTGNRLRQLTVMGAQVGVEVTGGEDARLQNVILRDNTDAGLYVLAGAAAELTSATVARNGAGVRVKGRLALRNGIVTGNQVGVEAAAPESVTSRYNDVFGNRDADHRGAARADTDLAAPVSFGGGEDDLRLAKAQASTDRGDPADEFANEPLPNGDRINLGAFGNTPFAELSDPLPPPPPGVDDPPPARGGRPGGGGGLCALGAGAGGSAELAPLFVALLLLGRLRRGGRSR